MPPAGIDVGVELGRVGVDRAGELVARAGFVGSGEGDSLLCERTSFEFFAVKLVVIGGALRQSGDRRRDGDVRGARDHRRRNAADLTGSGEVVVVVDPVLEIAVGRGDPIGVDDPVQRRAGCSRPRSPLRRLRRESSIGAGRDEPVDPRRPVACSSRRRHGCSSSPRSLASSGGRGRCLRLRRIC